MKNLMLKHRMLTPIALGVLLASASVLAQQAEVEQGWFIQGDIAQAKSYGQQAKYSDINLSEKRRAWKASTGYRFNNNIAVALNYADLGVVEDFANRAALESVAGKAAGLSAIYSIPFTNTVNAHAKLGYAHLNGRKNRLASGGHATASNSDDAAFFGAGMSFDLTQSLSLLLDWERYNFDSVSDLASAGLRYTFGSIAQPMATAAPVYIKPEPVVELEPPKPAPEIALKPLQVNLYFDNDSSRLNHEALEILAQAKNQLVKERIDSVDISGFSSGIGRADYNKALSERRAKTVVEYIRNDWGLNSNQVNVVAHGEAMLLNTNKANNSYDRRVMVKISFN